MQSGRKLSANKTFVTRSAGNTESVEWNVPNKFLPVGQGEVFGDRARNACLTEIFSDLVSARLCRTFEFAKNHFAMVDMADDAWFDPIQADETKPTKDGVR